MSSNIHFSKRNMNEDLRSTSKAILFITLKNTPDRPSFLRFFSIGIFECRPTHRHRFQKLLLFSYLLSMRKAHQKIFHKLDLVLCLSQRKISQSVHHVLPLGKEHFFVSNFAISTSLRFKNVSISCCQLVLHAAFP